MAKQTEVDRHVFAVMNPVAGSCDKELLQEQIARSLAPAGYTWEIYETGLDENALGAKVKNAITAGCQMVVAIGGDGTVCQVANRLIGTNVPLGVIPMGTWNLVARELQIPLDTAQACDLLIKNQRTQTIDVLRCQDMTFLAHVAVGLHTKLFRGIQSEDKGQLGRAAYLRAMLSGLFHTRSWRFNIEVDGQCHRVRGSAAVVLNMGHLGLPGLDWGEHVDATDGAVDVCVVRARGVREFVKLLWDLLRRQHTKTPLVQYFRGAHRVRIWTRKRLPVRADGEDLGTIELDVKVLPAAVRVVVPLRLDSCVPTDFAAPSAAAVLQNQWIEPSPIGTVIR